MCTSGGEEVMGGYGGGTEGSQHWLVKQMTKYLFTAAWLQEVSYHSL